jgi:NADPH-dependent 2,4-dienoyl-CoA reductase/sulfur reductase-like enzyme
LGDVFTLRDYKDNQDIKATASGAKNIVIIGASFIGMEMASNLKKLYPSANITVVDRNSSPFHKILGIDIGSALRE